TKSADGRSRRRNGRVTCELFFSYRSQSRSKAFGGRARVALSQHLLTSQWPWCRAVRCRLLLYDTIIDLATIKEKSGYCNLRLCASGLQPPPAGAFLECVLGPRLRKSH